MTKTLISSKNLAIGYRNALCRGIDFEVSSGQRWIVCGENGVGKSTLFRTLLGFLPKIGGEYAILTDRIHVIFQRASLDPFMPMRVRDLVAMGIERKFSFLKAFGRKRIDIDEALERAHCEELASSQFFKLSEGQKQRVLLARAFASRAELLFLDESTSAMDPENTRLFYESIVEYTLKTQASAMMITHAADYAARYATHTLRLANDTAQSECIVKKEVV